MGQTQGNWEVILETGKKEHLESSTKRQKRTHTREPRGTRSEGRQGRNLEAKFEDEVVADSLGLMDDSLKIIISHSDLDAL